MEFGFDRGSFVGAQVGLQRFQAAVELAVGRPQSLFLARRLLPSLRPHRPLHVRTDTLWLYVLNILCFIAVFALHAARWHNLPKLQQATKASELYGVEPVESTVLVRGKPVDDIDSLVVVHQMLAKEPMNNLNAL
ncbi:hypothetical protein Cni_G02115 [Canna indica]|uniref:Uncharacterized protein n=1 Tax=Canna indica TaxID=4628 RepID=A0AAQ3JQE9_9LILI|nr:hypothetical protein Cni_G02115 [Canna indica]